MDTNQIKNFSGELTGENDAFSKMFGLELTRQQRIMGFVGCLIAGFVMSLLGSILLVTGSLATFAVLYSVGVVVSLTGTGFLLGFMKQFKQMFNKVRVAFTAAMIASFIMVWVSAFAIDSTVRFPQLGIWPVALNNLSILPDARYRLCRHPLVSLPGHRSTCFRQQLTFPFRFPTASLSCCTL